MPRPLQQFFLGLNDALLALSAPTRRALPCIRNISGRARTLTTTSKAGTTFHPRFSRAPLILVVSALSAVLFYWRILPGLVKAMSLLLEKTMGVGGAVAFHCC